MSLPSLSTQLLAVSILTLQRQIAHYNIASRSTWNTTYDFIVVGAGGAGAIVASRLSENPSVSVLLLEAGGSDNVATDIPALYHHWVGDPDYDWNYPLAAQRHLGLAYREHRMSVGKVLGGSTTISGMVYNRGNRRHFDEWDYTYGCTGWNYNATLPYFLRAENQTDRNYLANNYHNTSGPITVSSDWNQLKRIPIFRDYLNSAVMAGHSLVDLNAESQNGSTLFEHTIKHGTRVTSSSAYLAPNINRPNLVVLIQSHVTRILFNQTTANSVMFTRRNQTFTVMARREIILSAGTIGSAQLLMLSGVGPQSHLSSLNISVIADRPVGNNLHDHSNLILPFDVPDQSLSYQSIDLTAQNLYQYLVNGTGSLSMFPNTALYISTDQNNDTQWPDIMTEMVRSPDRGNNLSNFVNLYRSNLNEWADYWRPYVGRRLLSLNVQMVRPKARGTLRLSSANPLDAPIIDPNYLGDSRDFNALVYGIRETLTKITNIGPFGRNARFISNVPVCRNLCPYSNEQYCDTYIRCLILQWSVAVYRHVGTCRCGAATNVDAVVDPRLRVINTTNLRVIDGSIMPTVINANSWAATAMIAEYGAQMIRVDQSI